MKKVLVTGGGGFLGTHIVSGFRNKSLDVKSLGRHTDNDIIADLTNGSIGEIGQFDMVVHVAGKAHMMPVNEKEAADFYRVNVQGTQNLLDNLEKRGVPSAFVFISTVAVYGKETGELINEDEPLLAKDPYGKSKIVAEQLISQWCVKNKVICTIFRLPLIAGPNPPGNLSAMIEGIRKGKYFNIGSGNVRKSIVLANDLPDIILKAASIGGIYHLTDGYHPSVKELGEVIAKQLGKPEPKTIPYFIAWMLAVIGDIIGKKVPINTKKLNKIVSVLTFDDSKARKALGWNPCLCLQHFKIVEKNDTIIKLIFLILFIK